MKRLVKNKYNVVEGGLSPILYHYTSESRAENILKEDRFALTPAVGTMSDDALNRGKMYFLSTTRQKAGSYHAKERTGVVFELDGRRLAQTFTGSPVDYWGRTFNRDEQEDRVLSNQPYILNAIKYIKSIHILYIKPDKSYTPSWVPYVGASLRRLIIQAKRRKIPVYLYTDRSAWAIQDTRKAESDLALLLKTPPTTPMKDFGAENPFADYFKVYYAKYKPLREAKLFNSSASSILENKIHNYRSNTKSRKYLVNLLHLWKKMGVKTTKDFLATLEKRYKALPEKVQADFKEWSHGKWIHYSKEPFLKINPKPFHLDMAGIYFFPEKFATRGQWHKFPYKFVVEMPSNLRVLDFAHITKEQMYGLLDKFQIPLNEEQRSRIDAPHPKGVDNFWTIVREAYGSRRGSMNKIFREAGYDAIFDDTDSIFSGETQLIVLDPAKIKNFKLVTPSGSGFKQIAEIVKVFEEEAQPYHLRLEKTAPSKTWSGWERSNQIMAKLRFENHERDWDVKDDAYRFASFEIKGMPDPHFRPKFKDLKEAMRANIPVGVFEINLRYSQPSLEQEWGQPKYMQVDARELSMDDVRSMAKKLFNRIFGDQDAKSP